MNFVNLLVIIQLVISQPLCASSVILNYVSGQESDSLRSAIKFVSGDETWAQNAIGHITGIDCVHPHDDFNPYEIFGNFVEIQEGLSESHGADTSSNDLLGIPEGMSGIGAGHSLRLGVTNYVSLLVLPCGEVDSNDSVYAKSFSLPASSWYRQVNLFTNTLDGIPIENNFFVAADSSSKGDHSYSVFRAVKHETYPLKPAHFVYSALFSGTSHRALLAMGMFAFVFRHSR